MLELALPMPDQSSGNRLELHMREAHQQLVERGRAQVHVPVAGQPEER